MLWYIKKKKRKNVQMPKGREQKKKSRIREQGDRKKLTRATVQEGQTNS